MRLFIGSVLLYVLSLFLTSCSKYDKVIYDEVRNVSISINTESYNRTKASSPGSEEAVKNVQVLLFKDGKFYGSRASDSTDVKFMVNDGTYDIYVFVNDHEDWISDADITKEKITSSRSLLSDNSTSSYVMFGHQTSFVVNKNTSNVTIPVNRFISKVILENLRTDFGENPYFKGKSLEIKKIYLSNIYGECPYSMVPEDNPSADDIWFCKMGTEDIPEYLKPLTSDEGLDIILQDGESEKLSRVYYTYPNGCISDNSSGSWSPRRTRLVIEAVLDGTKCWYHITLPPMLPNVTYIINSCTIKNMGGTSPEEHLGPACEVTITSSLSWDETYLVEEES